MTKGRINSLVVYIAIITSCIFVLLQSPLAPFANGLPGVDSSVFIYSAKQILSGQLMYKDIFDHKGPILYIIDIIGLSLSPQNSFTGIWLLEFISLFGASVLLYKTARLLFNEVASVLAIVSGLLFMVPLLIGGNLTEEWAILDIAIAQYIFAIYFLKKDILTKVQLFVLSITFLSTLFLKSNMIVIWVVYGMLICIDLMMSKRYLDIFKYVVFVFLFIVICFTPFVLYALQKNILNEALFCIFKYNSTRYVSYDNEILVYAKKIVTGNYYIRLTVLFCLFALIFNVIYNIFYKKRIRDSFYKVGIITSFLLTILVCSIGIRVEHYFLIFTPIVGILYGYLFQTVYKVKSRYFMCVILIGCFVCVNINFISEQSHKIKNNYDKGIASGLCCPSRNTLDSICLEINKYTEPNSKILVYGNQCSVYFFSNHPCAIKYPFTTYFSKEMINDYLNCIIKEKPKLIITGSVVNGVDIEKKINKDDAFWYEKKTISEGITQRYRKIESNINNVDFWILKD